MNIQDLSSDIFELVQHEIANKTSASRIKRQVVGILGKLVDSLTDVDGDFVVVVHLHEGVPTSITTNNPALHDALFVCTDNISVAEDEENAILVTDDDIVVSVGTVAADNNMEIYKSAAKKFARSNS